MGNPATHPQTIRLVRGLSESLVRRELGKASRHCDVGHRALAFYLHEMQSRGLHQSTGHSSAVHYAAARLGLHRRTARDLVSVGTALSALPLCDDAFCDGRLVWSKLRLLARIATPETEADWLEKALALTAEDLDREIAGLAKGDRARKEKLGVPKVRFTITANVDAVTQNEWDRVKEKLAAESGETVTDADLVRRFTRVALADGFSLSDAERRAAEKPRAELVVSRCCDCHGVELNSSEGPIVLDDLTAEMILCDAVSDETPEWLRKKIVARDGGACRHCGSRSELHVHHIDFRSNGGRTEPRNLLTLCRKCHALVHEKLLVIAGEAPHVLAFSDREGNPIETRSPEGRGAEETRVVVIDRRGAAAPRTVSETVDLKQVPNPVSHEFVRAHGSRFAWNPSSRALEFRPTGEPHAAQSSAPTPPSHRPGSWAEVVGQERVVRSLQLAVRGAREAGSPVEPILLTGEPGLGKTALAHALAAETGTTARVVSAPLVADAGQIVVEMLRLSPGSLFFIDEIHALPRAAMEALYEAVEDRRLTLTVREGASTRARTFELPPFTLAAATNEPEALPQALASRFAIRERLDDYSVEDLSEIVKRTGRREAPDRPFEEDGARIVARAARGTAREAVHLARRVVRAAAGVLDGSGALSALRLLGIDERGLDSGDRRILEALRASKKPLSLATLAAKTGIRKATLLERHEPYLLRLGLIEVTPLGRRAC